MFFIVSAGNESLIKDGAHPVGQTEIKQTKQDSSFLQRSILRVCAAGDNVIWWITLISDFVYDRFINSTMYFA
jgi:hypothetical protein